MRRLSMWVALLLAPVLALAGCGGVTADALTLQITVRANGLSSADRARGRFVVLSVSGDGVTPDGAPMVNQPAALAGGDLDDGETVLFYRTTLRSGTLLFRATLQDAGHNAIASGAQTGDLQSPNLVIDLVAEESDGGTPGQDGGTDGPIDAATDGPLDGGPGCGNGVVEGNELCDGDCPTVCPAIACQQRMLVGSAATCDARCVNAGMIALCADGDGCCPVSCNANNDKDCPATCGNRVVEGAELCDGDCPTACPALGCQLRTLSGSAASCSAQCANGATITACANDDGCCPAGCTAANDNNCSASCGDHVVQAPEVCDGNCPTSCPAVGCQLRTLTGSAQTCDAQCVNGGMVTACVANDGCCPAGCTANNDNNCTPICGNNVVESGELCDGNCPTTCPQMGCQLYGLTGTGCQRACAVAGTQTQCLAAADGCCPPGCTAASDPDCVPLTPPNDKCPNATDITAGGTFPLDFTNAGQDEKAACGGDGPDVFFTFTLTGDEWIYLDVLDAKTIGNAVPATIELYQDACPSLQGTVLDCKDATAGQKRCGPSFPVVVIGPKEGVLGGKALPKGRYFVAVRALGKPTAWALTYHHVPIGCASGGQLMPTGTNQVVADTTCQMGDEVTPSCTAAAQGMDQSYLIVKCPQALIGLSTCNARSTVASSLSAVLGSETRAAASGKCLPSSGAEVACGAPGSATSCTDPKTAAAISVTNAGAGLLTVSVDAATCGSYGLVYASLAAAAN